MKLVFKTLFIILLEAIVFFVFCLVLKLQSYSLDQLLTPAELTNLNAIDYIFRFIYFVFMSRLVLLDIPIKFLIEKYVNKEESISKKSLFILLNIVSVIVFILITAVVYNKNIFLSTNVENSLPFFNVVFSVALISITRIIILIIKEKKLKSTR